MKNHFGILVLSAVLAVPHAEANVGSGTHVKCEGYVDAEDSAPVSFDMQSTAASRFLRGVLKVNDNESILMNCKPTKASASTKPHEVYSCTEARKGEGRLLVTIAQAGSVKSMTATISQEQVYPLQPLPFGTISCQSSIQ